MYRNIYSYQIIKAANSVLDANYSYLIAALLHLESETASETLKVENFAEALVGIINRSNAFLEIDRACLAMSYPQASMLSVVSAFQTPALNPNKHMVPGYSCFVSRRSSLFKTLHSHARSYAKLDEITSLYQNNPLQRSLRHLADSGIKSGLTLSLPLSDLVSGYFFINSSKEGAFENLRDQDYTVLCLIKMVATSALSKALFGVYGVDTQIARVLRSIDEPMNAFSESTFVVTLREVVEARFDRSIEITVSNSIAKPFLFASKPTVYVLAKAIEASTILLQETPRLRVYLEVVTQNSADAIVIRLKEVDVGFKQLAFLQDLRVFSRSDIYTEGRDFCVKFGADYVQNELDYSV